VDDGRSELIGIVRDTRTLLARELARGRQRLVFGSAQASSVGGDGEASSGRLSSPEKDRAADTPFASSPSPPTTEVLALPGFELPPVASAPVATISIPRTISLRADLPQDLAALSNVVSACRLCGLCETRTQTVFSDGAPTARLVCVGEAPGRDEDLQGLPFVGRAGQLLNKMLAAIDLKREDVYICNVLKCRPPDNRTPLPEEVERCMPYLEQQIALVKPDLICALGLSAAQALLRTKASMTSMRGSTFEYKGIPLIPTYHPAALLRNPNLKREAWVDLQRIRDLLRDRSAA